VQVPRLMEVLDLFSLGRAVGMTADSKNTCQPSRDVALFDDADSNPVKVFEVETASCGATSCQKTCGSWVMADRYMLPTVGRPDIGTLVYERPPARQVKTFPKHTSPRSALADAEDHMPI
jgi:hypothetical protein